MFSVSPSQVPEIAYEIIQEKSLFKQKNFLLNIIRNAGMQIMSSQERLLEDISRLSSQIVAAWMLPLSKRKQDRENREEREGNGRTFLHRE